jgi:hypothetical protein
MSGPVTVNARHHCKWRRIRTRRSKVSCRVIRSQQNSTLTDGVSIGPCTPILIPIKSKDMWSVPHALSKAHRTFRHPGYLSNLLSSAAMLISIRLSQAAVINSPRRRAWMVKPNARSFPATDWNRVLEKMVRSAFLPHHPFTALSSEVPSILIVVWPEDAAPGADASIPRWAAGVPRLSRYLWSAARTSAKRAPHLGCLASRLLPARNPVLERPLTPSQQLRGHAWSGCARPRIMRRAHVSTGFHAFGRPAMRAKY